jgi:tRNA threonylcarbamoyladenosine biosynthesis protein TsaE
MILPFYADVKNEEETSDIARSFAGLVNNGDIIALNGNLGAGKTFFIKQVCSEFGIYNVNSPTFAIVNEYNGARKIYHFDFYRINNSEELLDIGIMDYLNDDEAAVFIEWGDLFNEILPEKRINIGIELLQGSERKIEINKHE